MSAAKLHISEELALPREAVTSTFVVYGGKGMGKTNFGSVFAEELSNARLRFAVIDPMGVWWGLRHSADGQSPGIELLILGGVKGDMPIEPSGGAVVADLVADESVNVLIDISRHANGKMWSIGERIRFVRDYFVQLYARQGEERRPLMQVVDEAARFCPQMIRKNEDDAAACLSAVAVMVEEGRNVGVGVCLLTQRSARLNKDVAELADCMISFRIVGPRSIDAVLDWFGEHIDKSRWKDLIDKLRKLPIGRALVVSPGWLEFEGEAQIRRRETFDSSATPKPGEKAKTPRGAAAKPDLGKYQERMAATIERLEANDPSKLKKTIAGLQATVTRLTNHPVEKSNIEIKTRDVPVLKDGQLKRIEGLLGKAGIVGDGIRESVEALKDVLARLKQPASAQPAPVISRPQMAPTERRAPVQPRALNSAGGEADFKISPKQQQILDALAFFESIGNTAPSSLQVGAIAIIDASGGHFSNVVGPLSSNGLVVRGSGVLSLTAKGREFAQVPEQIGSLADYHEMLRQRVRKAKSAGGKTIELLNVIISRGGAEITTEELGRDANIDHTGGHFSNTIGPLSTIGLIKRGQGVVRPTEILFPPGIA